MYYGFTESESFSDPTILNTYQLHKVIIERRSDGKGFWHIFILHIEDVDIEKVVTDVSKELKGDWNAMFFNSDMVHAVFKDKVFSLQRKTVWQPSDYLEIKNYAKACNVGDLDMNDVFKHYNNLLGIK